MRVMIQCLAIWDPWLMTHSLYEVCLQEIRSKDGDCRVLLHIWSTRWRQSKIQLQDLGGRTSRSDGGCGNISKHVWIPAWTQRRRVLTWAPYSLLQCMIVILTRVTFRVCSCEDLQLSIVTTALFHILLGNIKVFHWNRMRETCKLALLSLWKSIYIHDMQSTFINVLQCL